MFYICLFIYTHSRVYTRDDDDDDDDDDYYGNMEGSGQVVLKTIRK